MLRTLSWTMYLYLHCYLAYELRYRVYAIYVFCVCLIWVIIMCYILIIIYRFILFHQPAFRICLKVFSRYIDLYYFYQPFCIGISENRLESWNGNIGLKPSEIATFEACKMVLKMKNIKKFKKVWKMCWQNIIRMII